MNHLKTASELPLQDVFVPLKDQAFNRTEHARMLHFPSVTLSNFYHFNSAYASLTVAFLSSLSYLS